MDVLIAVRNRLQPVVSFLRIRPLAQRVYRPLLRLRYGNEGLARSRCNGRTWKLLVEIALLDESFEPETFAWLRQTLKPGDVALDIGANVGMVTLEMAELVGPTGRVVAVEPTPGNLAALKTHLGANDVSDRVTVVEAACTDMPGQSVTLTIPGDQPGAIGSGATLKSHLYLTGQDQTIQVPTRTIDDLCGELQLRPRAIKIDVEGAELEVLNGATATLAACRPSVWLAVHPYAFADPAETSREILRIFADAGYARLPEPGTTLEFGEHEFNA